ncbi:hypothetical protein NK55_01900 [Thermosynechococcus sp. NK55a]|jgi:hypothetical protein|uniref:hypothetical protein n=1 Tax=unclassified Thermosynechococcus TaxID=2622553 RepID=UPI0003D8FC0D|nr:MULTISPECIES: hypothetical protein [unclassified Thermosynechococcus]AHB87742.1 hypothetical protein NK55_01900 [Thermosynechococcus sp. NK55a]RMH67967.1 MAG: hypothetical protein D6676_00430 [Cyanobacteria bacterium J003]HIK23590.1 hypothetical protein [Thermosynechococcus sp. M3746_W2019_013]
MARPKRQRLLPIIILLWTVASLGFMAQWDLHPVLRYYGWVFTAQIAFLLFFLPQMGRQLRGVQRSQGNDSLP